MAEEKGFLDRWSKRKRAARDAARPAEVEPEGPPAPDPLSERPPEPIATADDPEIDPADLPPLDSIKSGADVQAFLQKGVPKALRRAALRRLWSADPAIREFREVADYDWDFNAPGYGALSPQDDVKAVAERFFGAVRRQGATRNAREPTARATSRRAPPERTLPDTAEATAPAPPAAVPEPPPAPEPGPDAPAAAPAPRRRRHGSAVPS